MDIDGVENKYTTGFVGDAPRMPTPDLLGNGEIALNIHKGTESLFFKNDAGEIVRFKRVPDWVDITNKPTNLWTRDNFNPQSDNILQKRILESSSNNDANTLNTNGVYLNQVANGTNNINFPANRYGTILALDNYFGTQISFPPTASGYSGIYYRGRSTPKSESWEKTWCRIWDSNNFNPSTKAELLHQHDWANINNKPAYLGSTFFSPSGDYIGVRTPARTAGQYYEFWDSNIGWAGIKAKNFQPDGGRANHFLKGDGSLDSNSYWHAGNFNPASKKDENSNFLKTIDTRNVASVPKSLNSGVYFDFKNASIEGLGGEGTYIGSMLFRPYGGGTDFSGGGAHQLGFSSRGDIFHRIGSGETWNDWNKFWDSGNFNPATKADIAHTHELESYRFKQINFATSPQDFAYIKVDRTVEEETHMDFTIGNDAGQDDFRFFVNHWQSPTPIKVFEINAWGAVTDRLISKRLDVEMWALKQIGNELCICFNEIIVAKFNPLQGFISMKDVAATGTI